MLAARTTSFFGHRSARDGIALSDVRDRKVHYEVEASGWVHQPFKMIRVGIGVRFDAIWKGAALGRGAPVLWIPRRTADLEGPSQGRAA